jgi:nickel-dependent lactate racemase
MLPFVLDELERAGVMKENVLIIFATGSHRTVKKEEAERLLGKDIAAVYHYISNDAKGDDFTFIGTTSRGTDIRIKSAFVNADIKILTGDVELHYFAGYGGGRKSVLPGIAAYSSIQHNYKTNFFDKNSRSGLLDGNPMYENMTEAAEFVNVDFTLNIVQNVAHQIIGAFAGDFDKVLRKGAELIDRMYKIPINEKADIVIAAADGLPHDINLYQAYKAIHFAMNAVNDNGVVILVAECRDGYENQAYYDAMRSIGTAEEVEKELQREFTPGVHKAWFHLTTLKKIHVITVTSMAKAEIEGVFKFECAENIDAAVKRALEIKGKNAKIIVMPHGSTTLAISRV